MEDFKSLLVVLSLVTVMVVVSVHNQSTRHAVSSVSSALDRNDSDSHLREDGSTDNDVSNAVVESTPHSQHPIDDNDVEVIPVVEINVPTRGYGSEYRQLGVLTEIDQGLVQGEDVVYPSRKRILPLYGRQTYSRSNRYFYFTSTDGYHMMRIPVFYKNRACSDSNTYGCEEIFDGDVVYVREYDATYRVTLYHDHAPRYIPYL